MLKQLLKLKPLSVNQAWQGRRFKTDAYKTYAKQVLFYLRGGKVKDEKLCLYLRFGLSSGNADFDNPVKCFVDCLQKKYGFNDNKIKRCVIDVDNVPKGSEYVFFNMLEHEGKEQLKECLNCGAFSFSEHCCHCGKEIE